MTTAELTMWIQAAAVLVAVCASIVALIVSWLDRRNARAIAAKDRAASIRRDKLMFELEALLKLLQNLTRGGHKDENIRKDMGAEARALTGTLGKERLPRNWEKRIEKDDEGLIEFMNDESNEEWLRNSVEVQLAMNTVLDEIRHLMGEQDAESGK